MTARGNDRPPRPDYDAPVDPHEPDGPGLGDDRYDRRFNDTIRARAA